MTMEDQSAKADGGKSNPLLLEADLAGALSVINRILDYGLVKYERKSWMKVQMERWDAACRRHRIARDRGQVFDDESGLMHMAHEATGLIIQMQLYMDANPGTDFHSFRAPPQDHKQNVVVDPYYEDPNTIPYKGVDAALHNNNINVYETTRPSALWVTDAGMPLGGVVERRWRASTGVNMDAANRRTVREKFGEGSV